MVDQLTGSLRSQHKETRVGVIGAGAIGGPIIDALLHGSIPGCTLSGILEQLELPDELDRLRASSLINLVERSDLIVEAAGQEAVRRLGPDVIESGTDLLVLSAGALVDEELYALLTRDGGGRLLISTGAIGGFDTLSAAMLAEPLESVSLVSRKPSRVLIYPWMPPELVEELTSSQEETEAFRGPAREAVKLFPESANIAATIALATVGFDRLQVHMVGVPDATGVEHRVKAIGHAGSYEFIFRNRQAEANPRTSAIASFSVIRALQRLQANTVIGI